MSLTGLDPRVMDAVDSDNNQCALEDLLEDITA